MNEPRMLPEEVGRAERASALEFLTRLGVAMLAADYPVNMVRSTIVQTATGFGISPLVNLTLLVLPSLVQIGDGDQHRSLPASAANIPYHQSFALGELVKAAESGEITAESGLARLDLIEQTPHRFPAWVSVLGYAVQCASYALMLEPTRNSLGLAVCFGLIIGLLEVGTRNNRGLRQLLPAISAFIVAFAAYGLGKWLLHSPQDSLRLLIPPLILFLPGVAITLAIVESGTGEVISGAGRLTAGLLQLMQLAFGIIVAIQLVGVTANELTDVEVNRLGPWAPWIGVALNAVGLLLHLGIPRKLVPSVVLILYVTYSAQLVTASLIGGYASGFGGGLALMLCALALAQRGDLPTAQSLVAPGFWLLVPSSVGLIGITELASGVSSSALVAMLAAMVSIALGFQMGASIWRIIRHDT